MRLLQEELCGFSSGVSWIAEVLGALTPVIRRSPPSTPLARSTKLLQKLERDLMANLESDTAPEQSDTQVYEWDEYNVSALGLGHE